MKTILTICILIAPLVMWSQSKSLIANGGDHVNHRFSISGSIGQPFVNQVEDVYSFSEGFQQYIDFANPTKHSFQLSIAPNPTSDQIVVESEIKIDLIEIFNSNGNLIRSVIPETTNTTIPLNDLVTGIYFVHCFSADKTPSIKKIIKL